MNDTGYEWGEPPLSQYRDIENLKKKSSTVQIRIKTICENVNNWKLKWRVHLELQ